MSTTLPTPSAARRAAPRASLRAVLSVLLCLSLVPALVLAYQRIVFETGYRTVGITLDYLAVRAQAQRNDLSEEALLARYRALGANSVAVYETNLNGLLDRGLVLYREGGDWRNDRLSVGQSVAGIRPDRYYLRSLVPGAAESFGAKYNYYTQSVVIDGTRWIEYPVGIGSLLAGPDMAQMRALEQQGFFIVYRPGNSLDAVNPGADFPAVPYIVYTGDDVTGFGARDRLERVAERTRALGAVTGVFESVYQKGLDDVAETNPAVRVFTLREEWQNQLEPAEVASKYVLAARERNHRLLYVRPFRGIDDTEVFLSRVSEGLARAGMTVGRPRPLEYQPDPTLRLLALAGPLLGLVLLATAYPFMRLGVMVAVGVLGLCLVGGGFGYSGMALVAAVVFPTLGFALHRNRPLDWLRATAITLMGGFFVAGIGAGRNEVLALEPFRGVALTLVGPPLLLALAMLPRQDIRQTVRDFWGRPLRLGDVGLGLLALAAVGLVLARRGNTPAVGVSATESEIRLFLQDSMIRPRTKEVLFHPLALLGLAGGWPTWVTNMLLVAGVIGQGSIVDSFAHYHTPLIISLLRTVNGLVAGALLGLLLVWAARWALRLFLRGPVSSSKAA